MQIPPDDPATLVTTWLSALRPGAPAVLDALALVPVHASSPLPELNLITLAEAHANGVVTIAEKPSASVPTLLVMNRALVPILILDGEEIVGGRQNRVVNTTLLVPAQNTFELDVTCVEHGRWHAAADETFAPGETVYPTLRQQKATQVAASLARSGTPNADQAAVWDEIASGHRRRGTHSTTHAVHDAYVERGEALRHAEEALPYPADEPVGVVAVVNGRAVCADIFCRPSLLRGYWSSLVRSYALEADSAPSSTSAADRLPTLATRLLASAIAATTEVFPSRGLGADVRLTGNAVLGAALVHDHAAVHVALFNRREPSGARSLSRPSARARRLHQVWN